MGPQVTSLQVAGAASPDGASIAIASKETTSTEEASGTPPSSGGFLQERRGHPGAEVHSGVQ
jgi:hypothetical protein